MRWCQDALRLAGTVASVQPEPQTIIASTPSGRLRGVTAEGLTAFKGIRYGQAPVGEWRFRAPREVEPWTDIRDATRFGPVPYQLRISAGLLIPDSAIELNGVEGEDCLSLNVYTPSLTGAHPVLMYIHGGNFVEGAGSQAWTEPSALARRGDVVVVTVNYRLGALGWLFLDDLGGRAIGADSNVGLLDQIAALRWISKHIEALGGDPRNVTVFGYSAGAWSITALLAAGQAPRLFQKALIMSGGVRCHTRDEATSLTRRILDELELDASDPRNLHKLKEIPPREFSNALERVWNVNGHPFPPIRPVAGAIPIPADPLAAIAGGVAAGVPMIVGSTLDEFKLVVTLDLEADGLDEPALLARFGPELGDEQARAVIAAYREGRASRGESVTATDLYWAIRSDQMFSVPGVHVAEAHAAAGHPTFMYQVRWAGGDPRLGACHSVDLALMFGTLGLEGMAALSGEGATAVALSHQIQDAWASFASGGEPRHPGIPAWPRYGLEHRSTLIFDSPCRVMDGPAAVERAVWQGIL